MMKTKYLGLLLALFGIFLASCSNGSNQSSYNESDLEWVYLCGEPKTAVSSLYIGGSTVEKHKNGNYVKNFQDYTNEFDTFNPELQHYQLGYCYVDENGKIITDSSKTEYYIRVPEKSDGSY